MAAAPVWVSDDLALARQRVRWFPALVSNHVVDLISRYKPEELPASLTSYVQDRAGYDYQHHAEVGSDNASFVSDEVVDRFCLVGPVEAHRQKLRKLAEVGVTQFNIYLMCGEEEQTLEIYKGKCCPGFLEQLRRWEDRQARCFNSRFSVFGSQFSAQTWKCRLGANTLWIRTLRRSQPVPIRPRSPRGFDFSLPRRLT